ncbi:MAG: hypothetical protein AAF411_13330 [Myxococcota bacterium]
MKKQAATFFTAIGLLLLAVGGGLYLGNRTGVFPTLPLAGGLTLALGSLFAGVGRAIGRDPSDADSSPGTSPDVPHKTSPVVLALAFVLFGTIFAVVLMGGSEEAVSDNPASRPALQPTGGELEPAP